MSEVWGTFSSPPSGEGESPRGGSPVRSASTITRRKPLQRQQARAHFSSQVSCSGGRITPEVLQARMTPPEPLQRQGSENLGSLAMRKRTLSKGVRQVKTKSLSDEEANIQKSFEVLPPTRQRQVIISLMKKNRPFQAETRDGYGRLVIDEVLPVLEEAIDFIVCKKVDISEFKTQLCSLLQEDIPDEKSQPTLNLGLARHLENLLDKDENFKHNTQPALRKVEWDTIVELVETHNYSKTKKFVTELGMDDFMQCCDPSGKNILHLACERNSMQLVHSLLKMGANPSIPTKSGETPFLFFMNNFQSDSWSSKHTFLPPIMNRLIDDPDNISFVGKNGDTVLHLLVGVGAYQQVTDALDLGASVETENKNKKKPMDLIFDYIREARSAELGESSIIHNSTNICKCLLSNMETTEGQVAGYMKEASILGLKDLFLLLEDHLIEESDVIFFEENFIDFPAHLHGQAPGTIGVLRGGVPSAVLSLLLSPESDQNSMRAFLCGYEKYFSAIELSNELLQLSETCDPDQLFQLFEIWMELIPHDFQTKGMKSIFSLFPPKMTPVIGAISVSQEQFSLGPSLSSPFSRFIARLNKVKSCWKVNPKGLMEGGKYEEGGEFLPKLGENFLDGTIPVTLVAKVLSMWNFSIHQSVNTRDVIEYINNQSKYIKRKKESNEGEDVRTVVQTAIDLFSDISYWSACLILTAAEEDQVAVMEWLITLVHECVRLNNMNTGYAILSSFQISAIFRLKALPKSISLTNQARLETYQGVFSSQKSYKNYRDAIKTAQGKPAVGYLGLLLRDIIYMSDSQPTYLDEGRRLINFSKLRSLYAHIESEHTNLYRTEYEASFMANLSSEVFDLVKDLTQLDKIVDLDLLTSYSKWKFPTPLPSKQKKVQTKPKKPSPTDPVGKRTKGGDRDKETRSGSWHVGEKKKEEDLGVKSYAL